LTHLNSADINLIGAVSKTDLKRFIKYAEKKLNLLILQEFLDAIPTAELEPITKDYVQSDEIDMGLTHDELSTFGRLRKTEKLGPVSSLYTKSILEARAPEFESSLPSF
jgi:NAD+ synthase (glutamine-hydrolysing)